MLSLKYLFVFEDDSYNFNSDGFGKALSVQNCFFVWVTRILYVKHPQEPPEETWHQTKNAKVFCGKKDATIIEKLCVFTCCHQGIAAKAVSALELSKYNFDRDVVSKALSVEHHYFLLEDMEYIYISCHHNLG